MKRLVLFTTAVAVATVSMFGASPKAIYVKNNDGFRKYSFGVASPITINHDNGYIYLNGYDETLKISDLEYISFDMPKESQLSSTQHKDRLIEIGEKVNSMIDVNDMEEILGMCAEYDNISYYDGDALVEKFKANHPHLYDEDEDYYSKAPVKRLIKALKDVAKGSPAATRTITEVFTETFIADDFTGIFTADHNKREWVKVSDADYLEIRYTGKKSGNEYCVRVTPSKDTNSWHEEMLIRDDYVDREDEGEDLKLNLTLKMPKSIEVLMTVNGKDVANATLNSSLDESAKNIELKTTIKANKYHFNNDISFTNSTVNEKFSFSIGGKTVTNTTVTVNGSSLLDTQSWIDALQAKKYEDEYEMWLEADPKLIVSKFKNAVSHTDILGELQVVGHSANFSKAYELLEECIDNDDDNDNPIINHDKGTCTYIYGDLEETERCASILNNYSDASFFYDGKPQLQGFLSFEATEYLEDEGTIDGYWDFEIHDFITFDHPYIEYGLDYGITPILTFADGSSFAFDGDYFNGGNFNPLIADYDNIVKIAENIVSGFQID